MNISFDIPLKVKSLLRDKQLAHPNPIVKSRLLEVEKQKWMNCLIAAGVRHLLPQVVNYCARNNKKLSLDVVHYCFKPLDDDNLIVSVNKFIVDSLVRAEVIPDDCPAVFRVRSFEQVAVKRNEHHTVLTFSSDRDDATGLIWHNWLTKKGLA